MKSQVWSRVAAKKLHVGFVATALVLAVGIAAGQDQPHTKTPVAPPSGGGHSVSSVGCRVAGIGANAGNQDANQIFSSGDLPGSIARFDEATYNAMTVAALRASYDVLLFTWDSGPMNTDWTTRLLPFMALGGGIIFEDNLSGTTLLPGVTVGGCGSGTISISATVPGITDGIVNSFVNCHYGMTAWDAALHPFITQGSATVGLYGQFGSGRIILTGPDQDYHGFRGAGNPAGNQYNLLLNEVRWVCGGGGGGCNTHMHGHTFLFGHANPAAHFFGHSTGDPRHGHHFLCANHAFGHTPYLGAHLQPEAGEEMANPGFVAGLNQDGSPNGATPASRGTVLQLFGSAAGIFLGPEDDEEPAANFTPPVSGSPLYATTSLPQVRIGGVSAKVLFSGLAPGLTGVWQINVQIPEDAPTGKLPVTVSYEGYNLRSVDITVQ